MTPIRSLLACTLPAAMLLCSPRTQCVSDWLPGDPRPTPIGTVTASAIWDPDGAGPQSTVLVIGGSLSAASSNGMVFTWNGSVWAPLGTLPSSVTALTVHNGELYAATSFPTVQRWDGAAWVTVGAPAGTVRTMVSHGGQLVAAGSFSSIGGVAANNVAAWNGTTWAPLGSGLQGTARATTVFNNVLYVGGTITSAGGVPVGNLALWNGTSWAAGPLFNGSVDALAIRASTSVLNSYVFVGGSFTSYTILGTTTPAPYCARYVPNSGTWSSVGNPGGPIAAMIVRLVGASSYELAALVPTASSFAVATYAAATWSTLPTSGAASSTAPRTINLYQGRYTVGLWSETTAVQAFTGSAWAPVAGRGILGNVLCVTTVGDDVVIGGTFTEISGATVNHVARGTVDNWAPLGGGLTSAGGVLVLALTADTSGHVVVGGLFDHAGGTPAQSIARWDGSSWNAFGSGIVGTVMCLLALPNGDVVAGGLFTSAGGVPVANIARWNGSAWSALGTGCSGPVYSLARLPGGDVVAAGAFATAGGIGVNNVARWDGLAWHGLGGGSNGSINATAVAPNGDLYVGGTFTSIGGQAARLGRWSAGAWSPVFSLGLNNASVYALAVHANGDPLVGGQTFSFSIGPFGGWSTPLVRIRGAGLSPLPIGGSDVYGLATNDDYVVAGSFATAGTVVSSGVARFHSDCPARATPYGSACNGLFGPLVLRALEAPWIGGTYRLAASTFGPSGVAVVALGTTPINLPLASVFADAGPGCLALLLPSVLDVVLPSSNAVTITGAVPLSTALIGATFDAQVLQFESVLISRVSSSNALELVVGQI